MGYLAKEEAIKTLTDHEGSEFVVRTKEEDEQWQSNILNNAVEPEVDKKVKEVASRIHSQYDEDLFTVTGKRKDPNQKTYEFLKQEIGGLVKVKEEYDQLQGEYEKLKTSKGDEALRKELEQVKEQANSLTAESEEKVKELQDRLTNQTKEFEINKGFSGLKFNKNIPDSVINPFVDKVRQELISQSEIREGKLTYLKEDGSPLLNKDFTPKTTEQLLTERLSDVLDSGQGGLGLGKDHKEQTDIVLPDNVRDTDGIIAYMKTVPGLKMHSKEWDEMYKKFKTKIEG